MTTAQVFSLVKKASALNSLGGRITIIPQELARKVTDTVVLPVVSEALVAYNQTADEDQADTVLAPGKYDVFISSIYCMSIEVPEAPGGSPVNSIDYEMPGTGSRLP